MASKFNNCFPDQTKLNFISFIRRFVSSSLYTSGQSKYFVSIFQTKLLSVASTDRPNDRMDERLLGFNSDICWILCLQNEIVVVNLIKTNDGYGYTTIKTTAPPPPPCCPHYTTASNCPIRCGIWDDVSLNFTARHRFALISASVSGFVKFNLLQYPEKQTYILGKLSFFF